MVSSSSDKKAGQSASACFCTVVRKASRRLSQMYDAALEPAGLKNTQRAILAQVRRAGPTSVGALAHALVMDQGALAHTLKPLHRDRLLFTSVDPGDRRSKLVNLTDKGREKLAESDELWSKAQAAFTRSVGKRTSEELSLALQVLVSEEFYQDFEKALLDRR